MGKKYKNTKRVNIFYKLKSIMLYYFFLILAYFRCLGKIIGTLMIIVNGITTTVNLVNFSIKIIFTYIESSCDFLVNGYF